MISKRRRLTEVLRPSSTNPAKGRISTVVPTITSHFRCQIAPTPLQTGAPNERRSTIEFESEEVQNGRYIWDFQSAVLQSCP